MGQAVNVLHQVPENRRCGTEEPSAERLWGRHTGPSLLAPGSLATSNFDRIIKALSSNFAPQPARMICHHAFYARNQQLGESAPEFTVTLRKLASRYEFKGLEKMLLNWFVLGLRDKQLQDKLAGCEDIDLKKAQSMASAGAHSRPSGRAKPDCQAVVHQAATSSASDVSNNKKAFRTHQPSWHSNRPTAPHPSVMKEATSPAPCASCRDLHERHSCCFQDTTCRACGRASHIVHACRSRTAKGEPAPRRCVMHQETQLPEEELYSTDTHPKKVLSLPGS